VVKVSFIAKSIKIKDNQNGIGRASGTRKGSGPEGPDGKKRGEGISLKSEKLHRIGGGEELEQNQTQEGGIKRRGNGLLGGRGGGGGRVFI